MPVLSFCFRFLWDLCSLLDICFMFLEKPLRVWGESVKGFGGNLIGFWRKPYRVLAITIGAFVWRCKGTIWKDRRWQIWSLTVIYGHLWFPGWKKVRRRPIRFLLLFLRLRLFLFLRLRLFLILWRRQLLQQLLFLILCFFLLLSLWRGGVFSIVKKMINERMNSKKWVRERDFSLFRRSFLEKDLSLQL